VIFFLGSVFSPWYFASRGDPLDHAAVNVALRGPRADRWVMTERTSPRVGRGPTALAIGPSSWRWDGGVARIHLDERTTELALGQAGVRGTITVWPLSAPGLRVVLDGRGRHRWWPAAPLARAEVALDEPGLRFSGAAYLDSNEGDEPLGDAFSGWTWCRSSAPGRTIVRWDVREPRAERAFALAFDGNGAEELATEPLTALPATRWGLPRTVRAPGELERTLEDGPFYARSLLRVRDGATPVHAVHEALDLQRFARGWVRALLPFRSHRETD
jgi:carotenoid 1,2-hydratase